MTGELTYRTVSRVVFPVDDRPATRALYIDGGMPPGARITGRRTLELDAGTTLSLGSYFNAFPAAYWQRDTDVDEVRLSIRAEGAGTARVWRSDGAALAVPVATAELGAGDVQIDIPLEGFGDGGALWLDLEADVGGLRLQAAQWEIADEGRAGSATVGMTTFNRAEDCLAQLRQLADEPDLAGVVRRIVVVDQGEDLVAQRPGFSEVADRLGDRLTMLRQRNIGGSGGFSRAMSEALAAGEDDYVILLDDDAISEPESLLRAVRFADAARNPVIVGGGMIHLDDPGVLYTQAEHWNASIGWVDLTRTDAYDHDFSRSPFRQSPYFHTLQRADFNGWWMCLIPVTLLRSHGLSWPLFVKGDDVEFGRRAAEAGVATLSIPGIAVWHLGWGGKAPTRSWEAYFLHRNRLIGELLHAPRRRPVRIVAHSFLGDVKPLLSLQYSAVRLRALAVEDILDGPDALVPRLDTRLSAVRELRSVYPDAAVVDPGGSAADDGPALHGGALALAATFLRHLLVRATSESRQRPQAHLSATAAQWPAFRRIDSALVDTADGSATNWFRRSRSETRRALRRSVRLHLALLLRWPRLARTYRSAAHRMTSDAAWRRVFDGGDQR